MAAAVGGRAWAVLLGAVRGGGNWRMGGARLGFEGRGLGALHGWAPWALARDDWQRALPYTSGGAKGLAASARLSWKIGGLGRRPPNCLGLDSEGGAGSDGERPSRTTRGARPRRICHEKANKVVTDALRG